MSRSGGRGSQFGGELLDLGLKPAHVFQRAFCQKSEFPRLARKQFASERGQGLIQPLQLLDRLSEDGFGFHRLDRNSAFFAGGFPRTRPKLHATLTSAYSAAERGSGTGMPSSRNNWMCCSMASWISFTTSSRVSAAATQPGTSGTYAPKLFSPRSITIAYRIASGLQA